MVRAGKLKFGQNITNEVGFAQNGSVKKRATPSSSNIGKFHKLLKEE